MGRSIEAQRRSDRGYHARTRKTTTHRIVTCMKCRRPSLQPPNHTLSPHKDDEDEPCPAGGP